MNWTIPGTTLTARQEDAQYIESQFQSMFLAGGIVLGQVTSITGLDPYMIQNWVKRGFLTKPQAKRYTLRQLCRILNINMLRGILPMEQICGLLRYINGNLDDEGDDIIDDSKLYFIFVQLAAHAREIDTTAAWTQAIDTVLADYCEPFPGARERIAKVLQIMVTAWIASRMAQEAERMLKNL